MFMYIYKLGINKHQPPLLFKDLSISLFFSLVESSFSYFTTWIWLFVDKVGKLFFSFSTIFKNSRKNESITEKAKFGRKMNGIRILDVMCENILSTIDTNSAFQF